MYSTIIHGAEIVLELGASELLQNAFIFEDVKDQVGKMLQPFFDSLYDYASKKGPAMPAMVLIRKKKFKQFLIHLRLLFKCFFKLFV